MAEEAPRKRYGEFLPRGNVLEHFEWRPETNKLGEGTFGTVAKARCTRPRTEDMKVGDWYAVKVLKKERLKDEKHWRAVLHEVEILRRIKSPYCIQLFDAFQSDTAVYLILEYVDGGELFDFIIQRGHLSEQEANHISRQLLEALRFLHCDQKIVHRDLKPENILMVKDRMQIKIIDFGFAKFFGQPQTNTLYPFTPNPGSRDITALSPGATIPSTPSELIMTTPLGSLKYCAPEILKRLVTHGVQARVTTRVDIQKLDMFAAGVVVYVMLGGAFPFSSKSRQALAIQIERGIKFPEERFKDVSEDAKDFCRWMLNPDRKKRPLSFEAFNHRWLRSTVPATPLEIWQHGNKPEPIDNDLFDEIRNLEKAEEKNPANPLPIDTQVAPKPEQRVMLKPPKKVPGKKTDPPPPAAQAASSPEAGPKSYELTAPQAQSCPANLHDEGAEKKEDLSPPAAKPAASSPPAVKSEAAPLPAPQSSAPSLASSTVTSSSGGRSSGSTPLSWLRNVFGKDSEGKGKHL
eukprot:GGOE01041617.1.p1 GENE.GGOE01041617.1~~GGOE01041617.1.p1  ORF type:complete len:541 (+),score=169.12 GGOE01041617.1:67-1623(+)